MKGNGASSHKLALNSIEVNALQNFWQTCLDLSFLFLIALDCFEQFEHTLKRLL